MVQGDKMTEQNFEKYDDEQFQKYILNTLMSSKDIYIRCANIVEPEYFKGKNKKAIEYIGEFATKYSSLPSIQQVKANTNVEVEVDNNINEFQHDGMLDEIEGFCKHQAFTKAMIDGSYSIESGKYGEAKSFMETALLVGLQKDLGTNYFEDPSVRNQRLKDAQGTIKTGWKDIDFRLFGGFGTGELEIFVAPSGGGKSIALQNVSLNFAKSGLNGVYITLELKEELVSQRMDCMLTGMSKKALYDDLELAGACVQRKGKAMGGLWVKRMPESATTVDDIRAYLRELTIKEGIKVDYVCVDYLDLLGTPMADSKDVFMKDKYVSEELRMMAFQLDLCCVTASQLNRSAVEETEYTHGNISGGLSKIMTADNVIGIFNTLAMRERSEIQFQFLKTRNSNGVGLKVALGFNVDTLLIEDHVDPNINGVGGVQTAVLSAKKLLINPSVNHNHNNSTSNSNSNIKESQQKTVNTNTNTNKVKVDSIREMMGNSLR